MFKVEIGWLLGDVDMHLIVLWKHLCSVHVQPLFITLIGNNWNHEKKLGILRLGPTQKEVEQGENVEKHHMQRAQRKAIKVSIDTMIPTLQPIEVIVRERKVREATHDIVLYIQNKVSNLPSDESNK